MKAQLQIPLGGKTLTIEGEGKPGDIVEHLSFWSQMPSKCENCNSLNIGLSHRQTKDDDHYYGLKCNDCTADFNFHQRKKGGFYITKDDKWSIWEAPALTNEKRDRAPDDDIPF